MGELKSAYERALERAEGLGRQPAEELKEKEQEQYASFGTSLAEQFLRHGDERLLDDGLGKHRGASRPVVAAAVLSRLVDGIGFDSDRTRERALQGIRKVHPAPDIEEAIRSLVTEYKAAETEAYRQSKEATSGATAGLLHEIGVTGSAIAEVKPGAGTVPQDVAAELRSRFGRRLEELKQRLLSADKEPPPTPAGG